MNKLYLCSCLLAVYLRYVTAWSLSPGRCCGSSLKISEPFSSRRQRLYHCHQAVTGTTTRSFISHFPLSSSTTPSEENNGDDSRAPMELPPHSSHSSITTNATSSTPRSIIQRAKSYFNSPADGLTFRQRLAKLGLNAILSYGWVSNMSYSVTVSLAWFIFSRQTGKSPLAPGQWKGFLAVYAGFWVFNNLVRPIRLAVSVGVAPVFERIIADIQTKLKVSKGTAIVVTMLAANLVGTILFMSAGILLAATLAGVPVFAK